MKQIPVREKRDWWDWFITFWAVVGVALFVIVGIVQAGKAIDMAIELREIKRQNIMLSHRVKYLESITIQADEDNSITIPNATVTWEEE